MADQIRELVAEYLLLLTDADGTHRVSFDEDTVRYVLETLGQEDERVIGLLEAVVGQMDNIVRRGSPLTVQMELISDRLREMADYIVDNNADLEEALDVHLGKQRETQRRASYVLSGQRPPERDRFYHVRKIA